jgi:hypothetical protein
MEELIDCNTFESLPSLPSSLAIASTSLDFIRA